MLGAIKEMIATKSAFVEAADILFEDGSGTNIDNTIVLGEETEEPMNDDIEEGGDQDPETDVDDNVSGEENSSDVLDAPADPVAAPEQSTSGEDDILDTPVDGPIGGSDLPTPVGRQTGEPIDGIDDILNAEIDLKSNTMKDTLPIPPATASDAVSDANDEMDSFMNQRIDAGYGGDAATESSTYTEGISLDGGDGSDDTSTSSEGSTDGGGDSTADAPADDNTVTAAVKDKVDEIEDTSTGGTGETDPDLSKDKQAELMKKMGDITKRLEDAKQLVAGSV